MVGSGDNAESADKSSLGMERNIMTVSELDRFISKTELSPATKRALRTVRSSVISGTAGEPGINDISWSVSVETDGGYPAKMTFSWKKNG